MICETADVLYHILVLSIKYQPLRNFRAGKPQTSRALKKKPAERKTMIDLEDRILIAVPKGRLKEVTLDYLKSGSLFI